jgi:Rieske Fe-S protein
MLDTQNHRQDATLEPSVTRRRFLNILLGGGFLILLGQITYPLFRYVLPPKVAEPIPSSVVVGKLNELAPNSGKIFRFGPKPGLLIRTAVGEYRAFTATCTHLNCTVQYRQDLNHIWCACHDGHYDLSGVNIAGPPPRPLEQFKITIRNDEIVVSKGT